MVQPASAISAPAQTMTRMSSRARVLAATAAMVVVGVLFRIPPLMNADLTSNSDTAVVGLQAWHLARGELQLLFWGTDYQGIIDPLIAIFTDKVVPNRPSVGLVISGILAYLTMCLVVFSILRRHLPLALAAMLTSSVLVVSSGSLNYLAFCLPRMWSFAIFLGGILCGEVALAQTAISRRVGWAAVAGVVIGLGYYQDLFCIQLLPGTIAYLAWAVWSLPRAQRPRPVLAALAGFAVASIPRYVAGMRSPTMSEISLQNAKIQWGLFWNECLPYLLGFRTFDNQDAVSRFFAGPYRTVVGGAALLILAGLAVFGGLLCFRKQLAPGPRRLGWFGGVTVVGSMAAFVLTGRAFDIWGARYLNPVLLGLPFLILPAIDWFYRKRGALLPLGLLIPVALHFAAAGWINYGPWLRNGVPVALPGGKGIPERALFDALSSRGVKYGFSDYWLAYRLTFMSKESLIVVPGASADRYPPYTEASQSAKRSAFIFHPGEPRFGPAEDWIESLTRQGRAFEKIEVGGYTALVVDGPPPRQIYGADISLPSLPERPVAKQTYRIPVTLKNVGSQKWDPRKVFLTYHWWSADGRRKVDFDGVRTTLPGAVFHGDQIQLAMAIEMPDEPGRYRLEVDLVEERVAWFEERGSPTVERLVAVAESSPMASP